jgi:hypothetical protein
LSNSLILWIWEFFLIKKRFYLIEKINFSIN